MKLLLKGIVGSLLVCAPIFIQAEIANAAPAVTMTDADPALWVVEDDDTKIYLFGTVHVLKPGLSWFDDGVKAAYDASDELVIEVVEPRQAEIGALIAEHAVDADGPALTAKLGPESSAAYAEAMAGFGVPTAAFEKFEPWFVAMTLAVLPLQKLGYDAESGAEAVLSSAARADGKNIGQLETFEEQIGFFDSLSEPLQIALLRSTIEQLPEFEAVMGTMVDAWSKGDADRLAALMNEALVETPEVAKLLLADRNLRWAEWIDARMDKPGTVFVAVGAGHLAGAGSVQDALEAHELEAVRVDY